VDRETAEKIMKMQDFFAPLRPVEEIISELPLADRAAVSSAIEAAYRRGREDSEREISHRERLAARDAAIRRALSEHYAGMPATTSAKALASDLTRYAAGPWLRERALQAPPPGASALRIALHKIVRLNEGAPLGYRRLLDIASARRRRKCNIPARSCTNDRSS
jgi:hypothetical protein